MWLWNRRRSFVSFGGTEDLLLQMLSARGGKPAKPGTESDSTKKKARLRLGPLAKACVSSFVVHIHGHGCQNRKIARFSVSKWVKRVNKIEAI